MKELLMFLNFMAVILAGVIGAVCLTSGDAVRETMNLSLMGWMACAIAGVGFLNIVFWQDQRWREYEHEQLKKNSIQRPPLNSDA